MEITCPRCRSRHQIDAPASSRTRARALKFRCSDCGHTFPVHTESGVAPPPALLPVEPPSRHGPDFHGPSPGEPIQMLRAGGTVFAVPDAASLQRWILEQRVTRQDTVSLHGMRWTALGDRPDYAIFFAAAERLSSSTGPTLSPAPSPLRTIAPPPEEDEIFVDEGNLPPRDGVDEVPAGMTAAVYGPGDPAADALPEETATWLEHPENTNALPFANMPEVGLGPEPDTQEATVHSLGQEGLPRWSEAEPEPTSAHQRLPVRQPSKPPSPDPFFTSTPMVTITPRNATDVFEEPQGPKRGNTMLWIAVGLCVFAVFLLGAVLANAFLWRKEPAPAPTIAAAPMEKHATAVAPPPPEPAAAAPAPAPAPAPGVAPEPAPAPEPAAAAPPVPPAPKPEPAPKPVTAAKAAPVAKAKPADGGGSVKSLTDAGWRAIDKGDVDKAHGLFARALQKDPRSGWALYGRGYANEKLRDPISAQADYCEAMSLGRGDTELTRELEGGLRRLGKACN